LLRFAVLGIALAVVLATILLPPPVQGSHVPYKGKIEYIIHLSGEHEKPVFSPLRLLVPATGFLVNLTIIYDGQDFGNHTLTFKLKTGDVLEGTDREIVRGDTVYMEFEVNETNKIKYNPTSRSAENGTLYQLTEKQGGMYFYCIPHEGLGMKGTLVVGGETTATEGDAELGLFIRAYWIGLIGFAVMLLVVFISYYVIKSESRHHTDAREHQRKGLP